MSEQVQSKWPDALEQAMRDAIMEIRELRRRNELLSARVNTMDDLLLLLRTAPTYQLQGACKDVAWQIEQLLQKGPQ